LSQSSQTKHGWFLAGFGLALRSLQCFITVQREAFHDSKTSSQLQTFRSGGGYVAAMGLGLCVGGFPGSA
jgi:hypothetical protein